MRAGWIVIADIQHLGRTIVIGKPGGEPMPFSCRVESTTTDHRRTEWMGHPPELRHHAGGFAIHNKSCLLPCAVVKSAPASFLVEPTERSRARAFALGGDHPKELGRLRDRRRS